MHNFYKGFIKLKPNSKEAAEKYGMMMDFCGGALGFTSEESLQEQNKKMGGNGI